MQVLCELGLLSSGAGSSHDGSSSQGKETIWLHLQSFICFSCRPPIRALCAEKVTTIAPVFCFISVVSTRPRGPLRLSWRPRLAYAVEFVPLNMRQTQQHFNNMWTIMEQSSWKSKVSFSFVIYVISNMFLKLIWKNTSLQFITSSRTNALNVILTARPWREFMIIARKFIRTLGFSARNVSSLIQMLLL